MRVSQEDVRRCLPDGEAQIDDIGAVCRRRLARDLEVMFVDVSVDKVSCVSRAVRSCEAVARRWVDASAEDAEGTTQTEVIGAACGAVVPRRDCE
jgi:hypothetical protein